MPSSLTKPFLFVQCRPAGAIADDERRTIEMLGGLSEGTTLRSLMLLDYPDVDPVHDLDLAGDYAGIIISGSPYSARSILEQSDPQRAHMHARIVRLAGELLEHDIPTLGLCYGLQMLAIAAGESLVDTYSEDLQAVTVSVTKAGRDDPIAQGMSSPFRAFVGHTDSLERVPEGGTLLARGDYCPHQLVRMERNIYGSQFHPEITTPGMQLRIDAYAGHYYGEKETQEVIRRCMTQDVTSGNALITRFVEYFRERA